eukprot:6092264-Ditylum_brightwellii.AAC.1
MLWPSCSPSLDALGIGSKASSPSSGGMIWGLLQGFPGFVTLVFGMVGLISVVVSSNLGDGRVCFAAGDFSSTLIGGTLSLGAFSASISSIAAVPAASSRMTR